MTDLMTKLNHQRSLNDETKTSVLSFTVFISTDSTITVLTSTDSTHQYWQYYYSTYQC